MIDSSINECNEHFYRLTDICCKNECRNQLAELKKAILLNLQEYTYLSEKRKNIAEKVESALCVMVSGW